MRSSWEEALKRPLDEKQAELMRQIQESNWKSAQQIWDSIVQGVKPEKEGGKVAICISVTR